MSARASSGKYKKYTKGTVPFVYIDVGGKVKYKKGAKIDGHHTEKVSENHDKMTDPRTIEFMEQSDHIKYHQQNGY